MNISDTGFWDAQTAHLFHGHSQPLVEWIAKFLENDKEKQLYDFGCGTGQYLKRLQDAGFKKLIGFEGDPPVQREFQDIRKLDLTTSFVLPEKGNVVCLEVAEHIPAQFESVFLDNLANACDGKLIMSWAVRGQGGDGHVNCLNNNEAIDRVIAKGFVYLPNETEAVRATIDPVANDIPTGQLPWFKNTTLVFKKV
jgi:SAM-dependent methyltransferase